MKRSFIFGMIGLGLLLALFAFAFSSPGDVVAADHVWTNFAKKNVAVGDLGLWFDLPAGSPALNEAGLLWFVNDQDIDEMIAYHTIDINVSTNTYPKLAVRAALSDGAIFKVGYGLNSTSAQCVYPPTVTWYGTTNGDGAYRVKSANLPAGATVRRICIFLTDYQDIIATGRSFTLIDYIKITAADGTVGWQESFAESP